LLDYYREQQKLVIVDGCQGIDQVFMNLVHILRERIGAKRIENLFGELPEEASN
jgi:hypothetical protein